MEYNEVLTLKLVDYSIDWLTGVSEFIKDFNKSLQYFKVFLSNLEHTFTVTVRYLTVPHDIGTEV